jgi:AcrR family transcriptional regulator
MFDSRRSDAEQGPLAALHSGSHATAGAHATIVARPDARARILDALIATVSYRGYDRTTVERVLQTADVAGAVFEEHFLNKEECFLLALDGLITRARTRVLDHAGRTEAWPERVRLGLSALLSTLAEDPEAARVWMVESLSAGASASERQRTALGFLTTILDEGRPHAAYPEQLSKHISEALVGGIASILHRRILEERTTELPGLLADLTYFALVPYLGHHRALLAAGVDLTRPGEAGVTLL